MRALVVPEQTGLRKARSVEGPPEPLETTRHMNSDQKVRLPAPEDGGPLSWRHGEHSWQAEREKGPATRNDLLRQPIRLDRKVSIIYKS